MATTMQPATLTPDAPAEPFAAQAEERPQRPGVLTRVGSLLGVVLLALAYVLPGLTGHDPWIPQEVSSVGIIHNMVATGDLVVPVLASEPFLENPPAYYISGAGLVQLLRDWLPMHEAARVTTAVYLAVVLLFTGLMARRAWGPGLGGAAVLALIGTLGLIRYGHLMAPDIALAAGMIIGCYGLLRARESVAWGGLWLGTGAGLAFMSKGLLGPGILGVSALLLVSFSDWRSRRYLRALGMALVAAAPWFLVWPAELYLRAPDLFGVWVRANDPGQYLLRLSLAPPAQGDLWLRTLPWLIFPLVPFALWTLARRPGLAFGNPGVRVALVVSLAGWGGLLYAGTARHLDALPLFAPLAVIAAGGVRDLPGWLVALCYWVCLLAFTALAAALWGIWGYGLVTGQPPQWPFLGRILPLDFQFRWEPNAVLLALAFTLAWVLAVKRLRLARPAALAAWPLGVTLAWGLVAWLYLPWVNVGNGDREVYTELAARIPPGAGCVATPADERNPAEVSDWNRMSLGVSERSLLHYYAGIEAAPAASLRDVSCDWVVVWVSGSPPTAAFDLGIGWERVWDGPRLAEQVGAFVLFRRSDEIFPEVAPDTPVGPGRPDPGPQEDQPPEGPIPLDTPAVPEPEPQTSPVYQPEQEMIPHA